MEGLVNTFPRQSFMKPFIFNPNTIYSNLPIVKLRTGCLERELKLGSRRTKCQRSRKEGFVESSVNEQEEEEDWELEFLGVRDPKEVEAAKKKKRQQQSRLLQDTDVQMDWCSRARKVALKSIESRGLTRNLESLIKSQKKTKKKKKKKKSKNKLKTTEEYGELEAVSDMEEEDTESEDERNALDNDLTRRVSTLAGGVFEEKRQLTKELFVQRLSQFKGPSNRTKEIDLNRQILEAQTAEDVLEITADMIMAVGKGLSPSPLKPLNIATALHRIAKNMEKVSMMTTHRLAFARQKEMSMLVGLAMMALPECSAQGISNISWALSKIGGDLLYLSEMDRVAEVALTKLDEFNSQNVANVAGAFASMRHSAPDLFSALSQRASNLVRTFKEQELAQLLWAFASLYEPADSLLDALDKVFSDASQFECRMDAEKSAGDEERGTGASEDLDAAGGSDAPILRFSRDQLGNIAWSYAVQGQLDRAFFFNVWKTLGQFEAQMISEHYREHIMFASQAFLVNQCLKLEYPHLQLTLSDALEEKISLAGKTKRFNQKITSAFQKEVDRLLTSIGLDWVGEYPLNGYTLDAVVVDEKIALEIDGPTHFSRNTGVPLGHAMLKRRFIAASGWNVVSVSHQEWEERQGSVEQLEYLRELLKDHLGEDRDDINCEDRSIEEWD
ncbi:hypothetical protein Tsubulata_001260 [Turnera subulata]|uniref:RAP domain-containing protein n=1 Tax=Turnera subulata TaxID=218843 RepID=A0A9Q0J9R8_9ROSI|nr:hypothetical protein Tsubulata_001260 [Turnera subulata]